MTYLVDEVEVDEQEFEKELEVIVVHMLIRMEFVAVRKVIVNLKSTILYLGQMAVALLQIMHNYFVSITILVKEIESNG